VHAGSPSRERDRLSRAPCKGARPYRSGRREVRSCRLRHRAQAANSEHARSAFHARSGAGGSAASRGSDPGRRWSERAATPAGGEARSVSGGGVPAVRRHHRRAEADPPVSERVRLQHARGGALPGLPRRRCDVHAVTDDPQREHGLRLGSDTSCRGRVRGCAPAHPRGDDPGAARLQAHVARRRRQAGTAQAQGGGRRV
jgi:hypothetical protein